jgi:hypothetical protein
MKTRSLVRLVGSFAFFASTSLAQSTSNTPDTPDTPDAPDAPVNNATTQSPSPSVNTPNDTQPAPPTAQTAPVSLEPANDNTTEARRSHDVTVSPLPPERPLSKKERRKTKTLTTRQNVPQNGQDAPANVDTRDGDSSDSSPGKFRFLLQARYTHTFVPDSQYDSNATIAHEQEGTVREQDGYDIQRAFIRYTASPSDYIDAKLLLDIAEFKHGNPKQSFKLGYLQIHPTKRLELDIGLLKRTYSLLELLPIAEHELADLGPTDSFLKDQGYAGRDIGAVVRYSPLLKRKWLTVSVGAFRGDIDERYDSRPLKLMTARVESFPWSHLRLGLNVAWRPYDNVDMQRLTDDDGNKYYKEVISLDSGKAYGADATLLYKHFQVRAEGLYGDRTDPNRVGSNRFAAGWLVAAANFRLGWLKWVPAAKVEVLDLNPSASGGRRTLFTGVIGAVPLPKLRVLVDVTHTVVDDGLLAMNKVPWTKGNNTVYVIEPNSTSATAQVQYLF